jgi:hypothetical protein
VKPKESLLWWKRRAGALTEEEYRKELEEMGAKKEAMAGVVEMDEAYFENGENLAKDYESLGKALGKKEATTNDGGTGFDCANGEKVRLNAYLGRI